MYVALAYITIIPVVALGIFSIVGVIYLMVNS